MNAEDFSNYRIEGRKNQRFVEAPLPEMFAAATQLLDIVKAMKSKDPISDQRLRQFLWDGSNTENDTESTAKIRARTERLWGASNPHRDEYLKHRQKAAKLKVPDNERHKPRVNAETERILLKRDGHHCRLCGAPLFRKHVRDFFRGISRKLYDTEIWGGKNSKEHAVFQSLWLTYDHIIPISRGGSTKANNLIVTCQPCNNYKAYFLYNELNLSTPIAQKTSEKWESHWSLSGNWDGLESYLK